MIYGVGTDIVEVSRIKKSLLRVGFLNRCFTSGEVGLFGTLENAQRIAANFAAKEAFSKALGTGIRGFNLHEISVMRDELGKPYIKTSQRITDILNENGIKTIHLSISHTAEYATAFVVLEIG